MAHDVGRLSSIRIRSKVHELGVHIQTLTALFNDLHGEVFQQNEQTEKRLSGTKPTKRKICSLDGDQLGDASPSLLQAIMRGNTDNVRYALEHRHADPNETFSDIAVNKKKFATATPLVVAALLQQRSMVRMLVAASASVESTYSFIAGAEQRIWSGTVAHTAVAAGNLDLLEDLAELKADMNTRGSNGASLLWQASYFGKLSIMNHLLSMDLSFEQAAQSQDNSIVFYSPLHVAVTQGHSEIVRALLSAQASIAVHDGKGRTPLDDAIGECHGDIVHQLILKKANIFRHRPVSSDDLPYLQQIGIGDHTMLSPFDRVILTENPVLLSRVTQALAQVPSLLDQMSKHDLLQILKSPGDAPVHIMEALFQKQEFRYWEVQDGKTFRRQRREAMVSTDLQMNTVQGPHTEYMTQLFGDKKPLPDDLTEFMNKLFPQVRTGEGCQMYAPVTAYMCHLPKVHRDLQVFMAFADCPNKEIFRCAGVSAILSWVWHEQQTLSRFRMWLAVVELINFVIISVLIDETFEQDVRFADGPIVWVNGVISAAIWLVALFFEIFQFLGYWSNNSSRRYWRSRHNWFQLLIVVLTGWFVIVFLTPDLLHYLEHGPFSIMFGILLFLKWFKMLGHLCHFKTIAVHTLPITSTMWNIGPFLIVMAVYLFASVNLFYALRNSYGLEECFILIYRLVVLADFDLAELEHKTSQPTPTQYFHVVRIMLVGVSFLIGVTMMNLFIAVLCVTYDAAAKNAQLAFMESCASSILDQLAIRRGVLHVKMCLGFGRNRSEEEGEELEEDFDDTGTPQSMIRTASSSIDIAHSQKNQRLSASHIIATDMSQPSFLWFVQPSLSQVQAEGHLQATAEFASNREFYRQFS